MALVITVILIAVVTLMAITFLAMSRRERGSVTTMTDSTTAQLAADDALAAAEARIVANTLATTNPYNFGLQVSTNYINPYGFVSGIANPTNVNYYYRNGKPISKAGDFVQLLANLQYLPRAPVLIGSNEPVQGRFYLDLNRNGIYDTNGTVGNFVPNGVSSVVFDGTTRSQVGDPEWIGVLQHPDQPYGPNNPFVARYAFVAVPIGNALDLNNIFNQAALGIPNPNPTPNPVNPSLAGAGNDSYLRNQGVGSWEINLAAFLGDLNTNRWLFAQPPSTKYYYYQRLPNENQGVAFDDARALLAYRYFNDYNTLASANQLLLNPANIFPFGNIDLYSDGPFMTTPAGINIGNQSMAIAWAGSDNTNHLFDPQDLFDLSKTAVGVPANQISQGNDFTYRLALAGRGNSTYDRYTYYRLLSQMGVDSAPQQDQINLNYANAQAIFYPSGMLSNVVYFPQGQTNFAPWQPLQFFTIAADRMLRAYSQEWITESPSNYLATYGVYTNISTFNPLTNPTNVPVPFGISHIPVLVNNKFVYTPAVQRVLQLAANMYDATTNASGVNINGRGYPSVFRPIFSVTPSTNGAVVYANVYIVGYEPVSALVNGVEQNGAVSGPADYQLSVPVNASDLLKLSPDFADPPNPSPFGIYTNVNVYGVPWIIGAKKGFPNFNEFAMESTFQLTRKLEVTRDSTNDTYRANPGAYHFNQMFNLSVSNQLGVECWNSYTNYFTDPVSIYVTDANSGVLSNDENNFSQLLTNYISNFVISNWMISNWPGYNPLVQPLTTPASFQIPLAANVTGITNSTYRFNGGAPFLTTNVELPYETGVTVDGNPYPQPHWWLVNTNNIRVVMLDGPVGGPDHVIDYVQLSGPNTVRDLTSEIITNYDTPAVSGNASPNQLWNPTYQAGVPISILSQFQLAQGFYGKTGKNASPSPPNITWDPTSDQGTENGIDAFRIFLGLSPLWNNPSGASEFAVAAATNSWASPYQPTATVVQHVDLEANDPLVHYMASDMNWPGALQYDTAQEDLTSTNMSNLGQLNIAYMPWGGHQPLNTNAADFNTVNAYNLAVKDPLVWQSDDWDFPTYKLPTVGWLGRIHRGTPWQTVYLKSPDILREIQINGGTTNFAYGAGTWSEWTGNTLAVTNPNPPYLINYYDAYNAAPAQDRLLFDLFTTAPNDNATRGQLSVNVGSSTPTDPQAGLAAWSALLSSVQVLSNNASDAAISVLAQHNGSPLLDYTTFPINPAGPVGTNSPVGQIVMGINQARANAFNTARITFANGGTIVNEIPATFVNPDGLTNAFEHVGDILSVPQLSDESPFLNWNDSRQLQNGISEEMYDWLPQQVMSLLRVSGTPQSPMRYIIYSYGQTLKPAPNGIYTGSQTLANGQSAFGIVTNYQVVAESATRSVVNFGSVTTNFVNVTGDQFLNNATMVTNNTAQIQQFNLLAPY